MELGIPSSNGTGCLLPEVVRRSAFGWVLVSEIMNMERGLGNVGERVGVGLGDKGFGKCG